MPLQKGCNLLKYFQVMAHLCVATELHEVSSQASSRFSRRSAFDGDFTGESFNHDKTSCKKALLESSDKF